MVRLTVLLIILCCVQILDSLIETEKVKTRKLFYCHRLLWSLGAVIDKAHEDKEAKKNLCKAYSDEYYIQIPDVQHCPDYYILKMKDYNEELKGICIGAKGILLPRIYDEKLALTLKQKQARKKKKARSKSGAGSLSEQFSCGLRTSSLVVIIIINTVCGSV